MFYAANVTISNTGACPSTLVSVYCMFKKEVRSEIFSLQFLMTVYDDFNRIYSSFAETTAIIQRSYVRAFILYIFQGLFQVLMKSICLLKWKCEYWSFCNCCTFWGRLKMTISCKFNKLLFEKYSDWHSYSQGKIAGTGCWSLFLDKKICFCITFGKILSTLLLTNHEMLQVLQKEFKEYEQHNTYVWMSP